MAIFSALFGSGRAAFGKGGDVSSKQRTRTTTNPTTGRRTATSDPTAPGPIGEATSRKEDSGRRRPDGAPILGTAVGREDSIGTPEPPDAVQLGANNADAARAAALRARRKGAGASALTGLRPGGAATPGARLSGRTLLGY
jgi:hypothetical protein